jgi:hypothetical protein
VGNLAKAEEDDEKEAVCGGTFFSHMTADGYGGGGPDGSERQKRKGAKSDQGNQGQTNKTYWLNPQVAFFYLVGKKRLRTGICGHLIHYEVKVTKRVTLDCDNSKSLQSRG